MFESQRNLIRKRLQKRYDTSGLSELQRFYGEQMSYGHREILLEYLDLPKTTFFKAIITHGKILPDRIDPIVPIFDSNGEQILQALWRDDAETEASSKGVKAVSIGATGVYAMLNLGISLTEIDNNVSRISKEHMWSQNYSDIADILANKKVLYMPLHSWDGDVVRHNENSIDFLCKLSTKSLTVCLGYLDFIDPICRAIYKSRGIDIECAGIRASKVFGSPAGAREKFVYNLIALFKNYDFVIADEFTTGLYYAAALGVNVGILPRESGERLVFSKWRNSNEFNLSLDKERTYLPWLTGSELNSSLMLSELRNGLGLYSVKPRKELLDLMPIHETKDL